jgi:hypothetical protein
MGAFLPLIVTFSERNNYGKMGSLINMNQSIITLLASASSAIITGSIAISCSVVPKWIEIKNSTRETSRKEIKTLIEKLDDICSILWEDSRGCGGKLGH